MSRSQGMGWVAAAALLMGWGSALAAVTVTVTVPGGAVAASPTAVTLGSTDDALVFHLSTSGYTFPGNGAVVISGTGSTFKCTTTSKTSVTCKKTGQGNGSQRSYQINVLPAGSTSSLASSDGIGYVYDN